jgi:hypothetical protein
MAVFGAYLCLATHLAGVLHVLVVRHATCPGHGELVHGGAPAATPAPPPEGKVARGVTQSSEELDDHCLLMATRRREMAALTSALHSIVPAPSVTASAPPPALAVVTPRALLLLAPKTSPPLAA